MNKPNNCAFGKNCNPRQAHISNWNIFRTFGNDNFCQISLFARFESHCRFVGLNFAQEIPFCHLFTFFLLPTHHIAFFHSWTQSRHYPFLNHRHAALRFGANIFRFSHDWKIPNSLCMLIRIQTKRNRSLYLMGVVGTFKSWFHSIEDDDKRVQITNLVKEAISCLREKLFEDAIDILHNALKIAEEENDDKAINYIYDLLANIYYMMNVSDKALALFHNLMNRLLSQKVAKDDASIIEISLKMADLYAMMGNDEMAESGFEFCLKTQKEVVDDHEKRFNRKWLRTQKVIRSENLAEGEEYSDPYALYGMVLETYSRYLLSKDRVDESVEYFNRALEFARDIFSPVSAHVVIMLNNYAVLLLNREQFQLARKYYGELIGRAVHCPDIADLLPSFYCNYAETLWHCGEHEEAQKIAKKAIHLVADVKDEKQRKRVTEFYNALLKDAQKHERKSKV
ncbi:Tetratricopeptide repeat protein 19, mitochondrial [Trichinella sp. T8]|nr:Tetratricopeptide repeat protein 19, mitochondrial [Trichinella sp. T8]